MNQDYLIDYEDYKPPPTLHFGVIGQKQVVDDIGEGSREGSSKGKCFMFKQYKSGINSRFSC